MQSYLLFVNLCCISGGIFLDLVYGHGDDNSGHNSEKIPFGSPSVLLVSFDGFVWKYLDTLNETLDGENGTVNNFAIFKEKGAWAPKGIRNAFSTVTFPNHYSIATGLYEESHGILGNHVWDPQRNRTVDMARNYKEGGPLYRGEPIWATVGRQLSPDDVACYMWVGCGLNISGFRLQSYVPFRDNVSCEQGLDTVLHWLTGGMKLVLFYVNEPDKQGHRVGPKSEAIKQILRELNDCLGLLFKRLRQNNLEERVNVILTSDHGMIDFNRTVIIDPKPSLFQIKAQHYSHWLIQPFPGKTEATLAYLKNFSTQGVEVYRKAEIPARWHYSSSPRMTQVLLVGRLGVYLSSHDKRADHFKAGHGYDNRLPDMNPYFMAAGPSLVPGSILSPKFHTVDIYLLICHLLRLTPSPNNGSEANVLPLLRSQPRSHVLITTNQLIVLVCSSLVVIFGAVCFLLHQCRPRRTDVYLSEGNVKVDGQHLYKLLSSELHSIGSDEQLDQTT